MVVQGAGVGVGAAAAGASLAPFYTHPTNKNTLGRILPKSSLPFKTYSEVGGGFRGPNFLKAQ